MGAFIDMTGWKMWEHGVPDSKLIVLQQEEWKVNKNGTRVAMWRCECQCEEHNQIVVNGWSIRNGTTKSCGCFHKELPSKKFKKYNRYDLSGEYGIGWTSNTNQEFYFDLEDYDKIKDYCWSENVLPSGYHILHTRIPESGKYVRMHCVLGYKRGDHIDRNPLNNRKSNLRHATHRQNSCNRSKSSRNTSGITGVYWDNTINKWAAVIYPNGKKLWLGSFADKDDAIKTRLQAEADYYGEFAPQQHLFEQYNIKTKQND